MVLFLLHLKANIFICTEDESFETVFQQYYMNCAHTKNPWQVNFEMIFCRLGIFCVYSKVHSISVFAFQISSIPNGILNFFLNYLTDYHESRVLQFLPVKVNVYLSSLQSDRSPQSIGFIQTVHILFKSSKQSQQQTAENVKISIYISKYFSSLNR